MAHCKTCTCEKRKRCVKIVPASQYRKKGRCQKFAVEGFDWCTPHGKLLRGEEVPARLL